MMRVCFVPGEKSKTRFLNTIAACLIIGLWFFWAVGDATRTEAATDVTVLRTAIIVLQSDTIPEMHNARALLEKRGIKVENVFPPSVFVGKVSEKSLSEIVALDFVAEATFGPVHSASYAASDPRLLDGIKVWNDRVKNPEQWEKKISVSEGAIFCEGASLAPDLPASEEEKLQREQEYLKKWKELRKKLDL